MAEKLLGTDFEIHGGGSDLVFPHHENEIAQTEAARGVPLARIWMHNGMVRIAAEKMSKSRRQHLPALRGDRPLRAAGGRRLPDLRPLPPAARVLRGGARARRGPGSSGSATSSRERARGGRAGCVRRRAARGLPRRARRRLQHAAGLGRAVRADRRGQPPPAARRPRGGRPSCSRCSASRRCSRPATAADAEAERLLAERERARAERDFERADRIRDQLAELGWRGPRHARRRAARAGRAVSDDARSSTAGGAVAEAERGPAARAPGLDRAGDRRSPSSRGWRARPTTRGSSPRSTPIPTPTPAALLDDARRAGRRPRPDPGPAATWARSAGRPRPRARPGVVIPSRRVGGGHRGCLQGLRGRGRAPADRPGPEPGRLARLGPRRPAPGSTAPRRAPSRRTRRPT